MFQTVMKPAVALMGRLPYAVRFQLVLVLFLIPMAVLAVILMTELGGRTGFLEQERRGLTYIVELRGLLEDLALHRGMSNAHLRGNAGFDERANSKARELDQGFERLMDLDRRLGEVLETGRRADAVRQSWERLRDKSTTGQADKVFAVHSSLIAEVQELVFHVADSSKLILDQDFDSYYMMNALVNILPHLAENIGQARGWGAGLAVQGKISVDDTIRMRVLGDKLKAEERELQYSLASIYKTDPGLRGLLEAAGVAVQSETDLFMKSTEASLAGVGNVDPERYFAQGTQAIDSVFVLYDTLVPLLDGLFEKRIEWYELRKWTAWGIIALVFLLVSYLFGGFYRTVIDSISKLDHAAGSLADGDLGVRVELDVQDELSGLGESFNRMASTLQESAEREQRQMDKLRRAADISERVEELRRHIETVAEGDLTRQIKEQGDDDMARLGQNLNRMIDSLRGVTQEILGASSDITSTLSEVSSATSTQTAGASQQAAAVNETTSTLEEIRATSDQSLEKARGLGELAERTRRESEDGLTAVDEVIAGMGTIRGQMEDIAQTILALNEQTQQIGEITGVVSGLSQQSKMLALNASIEAAKAGEAGKGFAVVAAEVRELAEQSQQSTAQVQKILQDIRHATDRAVMATEEGSKGVDSGVVLVERSGQVMKGQVNVVRETVVASQQIMASVRQVATGIEQVSTAMGEINKVTGQFVTASRQTDEASRDLGRMAEKLRQVVSIYRI